MRFAHQSFAGNSVSVSSAKASRAASAAGAAPAVMLKPCGGVRRPATATLLGHGTTDTGVSALPSSRIVPRR